MRCREAGQSRMLPFLGAAINRALQPRLSIAQLCWLAG